MENLNSPNPYVVTGMFNDRASSERAYSIVESRGYNKDDVSIIMSDETRKRDFGETVHTTEMGNKAMEGAGTGSLIGGTLGAVAAAIAAAGTLFTIWSGKSGNIIDNTKAGAFASNGFDAFSPDGYSMCSAFVAEFILTMFFLLVILGATDKFANGKFAGIAIGLALTLIHLISIPITNTSVNPARSLSQALFVGGEPLSQVWLFWLAPILGAIVGGLIYKVLLQDTSEA